MQKSRRRSSVALLEWSVSYLKNDWDTGVWIMQKRLSRSSVAFLKKNDSYLNNDWDFGNWIMQKRLSTFKKKCVISQEWSCKNVVAEVV